MAKLADLLAQVNAKEAGIPQLREAHKDEMSLMQSIAEDSQKGGGWMDTKDALSGETVQEKVADFEQRTIELQEIGKFLEDQDRALAAMKVMRGTSQPAADTGPKKSFVGDKAETKSGTPMLTDLGVPRVFSEKMRDTEDFKSAFPEGKLPPAGTQVLIGDREIRIKQPMADGIAAMKAFVVTTPLPTDIVAQPYPMRVQPLDYISMRAEPGSILFYHTPEDPTVSGTTGGSPPASTDPARPRARGAALNERTATWVRQTLTKHSLGNWMPIAHEDINDNAQVMSVAAEQLMVDVKYQIVYQVFQGTNTGQSWHGLNGQLTTTTGVLQNSAEVPTAAGTAPNYTNLEQVHPLLAVNDAMTRIWERGMFPTVIFCNRTDYIKIRAQQRVERYLQPDYKAYPMGDVDGVPLCLTDQLPANTMIIADTDPRNMEIVMGQDITTAVSDDYQFGNNQRAVRVVCYGNFGLYRPLAAFRLTNTNNLRVVRGS